MLKFDANIDVDTKKNVKCEQAVKTRSTRISANLAKSFHFLVKKTTILDQIYNNFFTLQLYFLESDLKI